MTLLILNLILLNLNLLIPFNPNVLLYQPCISQSGQIVTSTPHQLVCLTAQQITLQGDSCQEWFHPSWLTCCLHALLLGSMNCTKLSVVSHTMDNIKEHWITRRVFTSVRSCRFVWKLLLLLLLWGNNKVPSCFIGFAQHPTSLKNIVPPKNIYKYSYNLSKNQIKA